jgi:hypothetical protein
MFALGPALRGTDGGDHWRAPHGVCAGNTLAISICGVYWTQVVDSGDRADFADTPDHRAVPPKTQGAVLFLSSLSQIARYEHPGSCSKRANGCRGVALLMSLPHIF